MSDSGGSIRARFALGSALALALSGTAGCGKGDAASASEAEPAAQPAAAEPAPDPAPEPAAPEPATEALAAIVATCAEVNGTVEVRRKGEDDWQVVKVGATFRAGDWIRAGERSTARVQFLGSTALIVEENSAVVIDRAPDPVSGRDDAVVVSVKKGVASGVVGKTGGGTENTPLLVSVDGGEPAQVIAEGEEDTEFRLTRVGDQTEVAVAKGELALVAGEETRSVKRGYSADVGRGSLGEVSRLVGFPVSVSPGVDARYHYKPDLSIDLSWKPVKRAVGYRVQVARDLSFQDLVVSEETTKTRFELSGLQPTTYAWRVIARDSRGRYGEYGFGRRIFCEPQPPSDLLLAPKSGTTVEFGDAPPKVEFSWQSAGSMSSYRLVVSRGADPLANPVVDTTTKEQSITSAVLRPGSYSWGVYTAEEPPEPLFLKPRTLVVKKRAGSKARAEGIWE